MTTLPSRHHNSAEWQARVELAALHRLAALQGWDELLFTHMSAAIPGDDEHFLLNPFGLLFEEITASSLLKVRFDGTLAEPSEHVLSHGAFIIHAAVHKARPDAKFIIHLHTDDGLAVASQAEGLLPLNQRALGVIDRVGYLDFDGLAQDLDAQQPLIDSLTGKQAVIMRNHGTIAIGATAALAWLGIFSLEKACTAQIRALSAGRDGVLPVPPDVRAQLAAQMAGTIAPENAEERWSYADATDRTWAALLRKLDREVPDYAS